jgi:hypothetical protein
MSAAFNAARSKNQAIQCQAPGCIHNRLGLDLWCRGHGAKAKQYGHPFAKPLKASSWAADRAAVVALLQANESHPGTILALQWVTSWIRKAAEAHGNSSASYKGAEEVVRLVKHGVTARAILVEVAAVSLWLNRNPSMLPSDRARCFAISRAVFSLAPRERRITRTASGGWGSVKTSQSYSPKARSSGLAYVGQHLQTSLAPFLANVQVSLETQDQQRAEAWAAMRAPLAPPLVV